ncbi:MAG: hypothetical protein AAFV80_18495 [Bacteroidota bacterium]
MEVKSTKLWTLVVNMDKYERTRFRKYLKSPYFNSNSRLVALFDLIDQIRKSEAKLTKTQVWRAITEDGSTYDDSKFRRLNADLVQHLKHFFAIRTLEQCPNTLSKAFADVVLNKKMRGLFSTVERDSQLAIQKSPHQNAAYHYDRFQLEARLMDLHKETHQREAPENMGVLSDQLDQFYFTEKLRYYCEALAWQRVTSKRFDMRFMPQILAYVSEIETPSPALAIYYQMALTMLESDNEVHYFELKALLQEHSALFPKKEARNMYAVAQNFCTSKINKGEIHYLQETFELYQMLLDEQILLTNNEMSPWDYKNLVVVGLRLGAFDWTFEFIESYRFHLPERFRENAYTYNLSKYYFYRQEYEKVIELLQQVEYQDVFYNLDSKAMLLKTYYELDEWEPMDALIHSFKALLRRKKAISDHHRRNYLNFIRMVKKLSRSYRFTAEELDQLANEIRASQAIADSNWLLSKVGELRTPNAHSSQSLVKAKNSQQNSLM